MKTIQSLSLFAQAYVEALYFTEENHDGILPDTQLSQTALDRIERDCAKFLALAGSLPECLRNTDCTVEQQAGHDFWLTRNGHGCGFWEKSDWPEADGQRLTDLCKAMGECCAYLGDDSLIHLQ